MSAFRITGVLCAASVAAFSPAAAQQRVFHGREAGGTAAEIVRSDDRADIDGRLDEAIWQRAAILTGFSSYLPLDGRPADDSTEVYLWYSASHIYVGIRAWETHGAVHATLAARDRIESDDYVQLLLDTFDDRRRAFVFGVNPLGAQADGVRTEGFNPPQPRGQTFGSNPPANIDLSPDFVFDSKGRVTDYGYEIELAIPLKSIRFQGARTQRWGFQVVRYVQHSGYQQTWTPARRGAASFLVQSGTVSGFTDLRRDVVVEANPEVTGSLVGSPDGEAWRYEAGENVGGNLRLRLLPNLTLNSTIRPDFSQVEADAAQVPGDTRFSLFFPERRPFFLDGSELFDAPSNLIYTRRIVQPDGAVKLTGRVGRTSIAYLGAADAAGTSVGGETRPLFNILRLRHDVGTASTAGLSFTDRTEGGNFSRAALADTRLVFGGAYSFNGTVGGSLRRTHDDGSTDAAPAWDVAVNRTGLRYGFRYSFTGYSPDFEGAAGFVPRVDYVNGTAFNRFSWFWKPGSFVESYLIRTGMEALWLYDRFFDGSSVQETKVQAENVFNIRGGWVVSLTPVREEWLFDRRRYANYRVAAPRPGSQAVYDTTAFTPSPRTTTAVMLARISTPQYRLFSGRFTGFIGRDIDFFETAPAHRTDLTADVDMRPSAQLRITASYLYSHYTRWRDNSTLSRANVPRAKVEYQLTRALFVRFVGQYDNRIRDALRTAAFDDPILVVSDGVATTAGETATRDLRADWLVSFVPSPGTVIFAGYGASLTEPEAFRFRELERVRDGFFVKVSYLLRR